MFVYQKPKFFVYTVAELQVENKVKDDIKITVITKYHLLLTQVTIHINSTIKHVNITTESVTLNNLGYNSIVYIQVRSFRYSFIILKVNQN